MSPYTIQSNAELVLEKALLGMEVTKEEVYTLAQLQHAYSRGLIKLEKRTFSNDRLEYVRSHLRSLARTRLVNHCPLCDVLQVVSTGHQG